MAIWRILQIVLVLVKTGQTSSGAFELWWTVHIGKQWKTRKAQMESEQVIFHGADDTRVLFFRKISWCFELSSYFYWCISYYWKRWLWIVCTDIFTLTYIYILLLIFINLIIVKCFIYVYLDVKILLVWLSCFNSLLK